jgi:hypothetical protein
MKAKLFPFNMFSAEHTLIIHPNGRGKDIQTYKKKMDSPGFRCN